MSPKYKGYKEANLEEFLKTLKKYLTDLPSTKEKTVRKQEFNVLLTYIHSSPIHDTVALRGSIFIKECEISTSLGWD